MNDNPSQLRNHWQLDPEITFLNHGSFGACPTVLLNKQRQLQDQIEREPVAFFMRDFEALMDEARSALGTFLNADSEDLALISNATAGVNTVLRSLTFSPGDELLTTDHAYNACRNAIEFVGTNAQAKVVIAKIPFPLSDPEQAVTAIMDGVTDKTRIVLLDHITSPTGLILPVQRIVDLLRERGIDCLIDGAHAPGMVDLDLQVLNPAYYTGNCHKWLCAPKGSAFLYVRRDLQTSTRPMFISHGANSLRTDRSRYLLEFDWPGTMDPTAWFCIPDAIEFLSGLFPDGWAGLRRHNHELALAGRRLLCDVLGTESPAPDSMIGSLASVELPPGDPSHVSNNPLTIDPLQDLLFHTDRIEVPVMAWPESPRRLLRIAAQAYNDISQYEHLATSLRRHLDSSPNPG